MSEGLETKRVIGNAELYLGDCLELMKALPDASVDLILCDPPYGTTACKWDSVIPFEALWAQYLRIAKPNAAIVLTASQPFTTALIASNMKMYRHAWVWEKNFATNFFHAKRMPLRATEDIIVFGYSSPRYFPQKTGGHSPTQSARGRATARYITVLADVNTAAGIRHDTQRTCSGSKQLTQRTVFTQPKNQRHSWNT